MLIDEPIPFPIIDSDRELNPVPAILKAAEFDDADRYFASDPANHRSLVSARSHVIIYTLLRNLRPNHVVEIGTYHGGTTEIMARAVLANGFGVVHTVGPYDKEAFTPVYETWPEQMRQVVKFYPVDSMAFYMDMDRQGIRPDLVFIDGDHSYEFALFDILCAARRLPPGGFVIVDDSIQAGPYFAVQDFMASHPDWIECSGPNPPPRNRTLAYDRDRTLIEGTSLMVLRGPSGYRFSDGRPRTFGEKPWPRPEVGGLRLALDGNQGAGKVYAQCVLCGFGNELPPEQFMGTGFAVIEPGDSSAEIDFDPRMAIPTGRDRYTLESWVIWEGSGPLCLSAPPEAF